MVNVKTRILFIGDQQEVGEPAGVMAEWSSSVLMVKYFKYPTYY